MRRSEKTNKKSKCVILFRSQNNGTSVFLLPASLQLDAAGGRGLAAGKRVRR